MKRWLLIVLLVLDSAILAASHFAQEPTPQSPDQPASPQAAAAPRGGRGQAAGEPRPYDQVITKDAKTEQGIFTVHRIKDRLFYEIPSKELDKEFLWVTQIERTQAGFGYGGSPVGNRVVRWQLRDKDVLLRDVKYSIRAESSDSVRHSVEATSLEPIIRKFPVAAWGTNKSAVIDVTDFFTTDVPEFSAKTRLNASGADKARSFIERIKSFPENIESKALITYTLAGPPGFNTNFPIILRGRDPSQSAVSVLLHHSMVRLPEKPMRPRENDSRVGFFNTAFEDFGADEHRVKEMRYVTRWRLEKKDPAAAMGPDSGWIRPTLMGSFVCAPVAPAARTTAKAATATSVMSLDVFMKRCPPW